MGLSYLTGRFDQTEFEQDYQIYNVTDYSATGQENHYSQLFGIKLDDVLKNQKGRYYFSETKEDYIELDYSEIILSEV